MSTNRIILCTATLIDRVARDISPAVKPGFVWRLMYVDEPPYWIHNLGYTKGEKMSTTVVPYMTTTYLDDIRAGVYPTRLIIKEQYLPRPLRYLDIAIEQSATGALPTYLFDPETRDQVYPPELEIGFYGDLTHYDIGDRPHGYHYYVGVDCNGIYDIYLAMGRVLDATIPPRVADAYSRFCERPVEKPSLRLSRDVVAYMYLAALYEVIDSYYVEQWDNFVRSVVYGAAQSLTVYASTSSLQVPESLSEVNIDPRYLENYVAEKGYAEVAVQQVSEIYHTITLEKSFGLDQAEKAVESYALELSRTAEKCAQGAGEMVWYPQKRETVEWGGGLSKADKVLSKYGSLLNDLEILGLDPRKRGQALKIIYNDPDPVRAIETILIKLAGFNPETARQAAIRLCQKHAKACMPW